MPPGLPRQLELREIGLSLKTLECCHVKIHPFASNLQGGFTNLGRRSLVDSTPSIYLPTRK